ncbi:MAG: hypothetical protein CHACPFDD_01708 [Phycisphaerae bacterium]|nr:hypothetical protein [Phycisphaerae bacterium]
MFVRTPHAGSRAAPDAPPDNVILGAIESAAPPQEAPASQPAAPTTGRAVVPTAPQLTPPAASGLSALIDSAWARHEAGDVIRARHELNALLPRASAPADARRVRELLARIADETVFSAKVQSGDPLVESYAIKPGDLLIKIAKKYDVPHELLMSINGIKDASRLGAGRTIKVVKGPFHAKISKSAFRLDLYLGELYVRSYPVGIGGDNPTPEGEWKVKVKLANPTYFPPASDKNRKIIPANDPKNPLGEHWIGLEGVSGSAIGQDGFGIHGTIEPDSIGRAVSKGCIRMLNPDVAFVYSALQAGLSRVAITP